MPWKPSFVCKILRSGTSRDRNGWTLRSRHGVVLGDSIVRNCSDDVRFTDQSGQRAQSKRNQRKDVQSLNVQGEILRQQYDPYEESH